MVDYPLAHELATSAPLSDQHMNQYWSIVYNLALKKAKGTYDPKKAPKLWMYLADAMARDFQRQYGGKVDRETREETTVQLERDSTEAVDEAARSLSESKRSTGKYQPNMGDYVQLRRRVIGA
jgi:hypothetical protein